MSDSWAEVTIGDIATIVPGKYLPKSEYVEDGDYFVYGSNSVMGKYSKFLIEPPHTVMAAIGAYAGAVRYSPAPSWVNNNAFGLLVKPVVLPRYFYLWLNSKLDLSSVVAGTGQPYVQRPSLNAAKVALPPLSDQKRVVDVVAAVDTYIAALHQQAEDARAARNAVLHELLTAGGDDWTETALGEVAEIQQGQNLAISALTTGEYPVYGANGIVGHFDRWNFNQDVVALGCRGSCGTVHSVTGKVWLANNVMAVWPKNESQVAVAFIALVLETADLRSSGVISGQVQPQITRTSLSPLGFILPPLSEQEEIVGIVSAMDDVITSTEQAISDAKELRSGLLSDLLSGDHEIPESYDRLLGAA
jgi:type I restriction enzyme S subunit